jgi:hypothetical protein
MKLIMVLLITSALCFSDNTTFECIGLGEVCTVAAALQVFELRNAAYPFDWIISRHTSLCTVLEQDFKDFLNPHFLSVRNDNHGIINKYGLVFVHDFPTFNYHGDLEDENPIDENVLSPAWINFLPDVQKKYARRIQRFHDVCSSDKKVYFIRHLGIKSQDEAIVLRNILKTTYPHLDFTLVVVGNNSSFEQQWGEPNIRNYHLKNTGIWNDVAEWQSIFLDLGLIATPTKTNLQEKMNYYYKKYATYFEK